MKLRLFFYVNLAIFFIFVPSAFSMKLSLSPGVSLTEEYTDNVDLTHDNEEEDFIYTLSAFFTLKTEESRNGFEISYQPSYSFYTNFSEFDTSRHRGDLKGWFEPSRNTRIEFSDIFTRTDDPGDEILDEDATIRQGRQTYYRNTAEIILYQMFGERDALTVSYVHGLLENEAQDIEDNQRHNPSASISYWFSRYWGFEMGISYTRGEFDISDDFDNIIGNLRFMHKLSRNFESYLDYTQTLMDHNGDTEDYNIYKPSVGIVWGPDQDTGVSFQCGYYTRDRDIGDNETGLWISGEINKLWARGTISLNGTNGYEETYFGAETLGFGKYYQVSGNGLYKLSRYLSCNFSGTYRDTEYKDIDSEREDKKSSIKAGLNYRLTKWMEAELSYSFRSVDSTDEENDYDENRVLLTISVSPETPYRM